jgi:hypothetical protein
LTLLAHVLLIKYGIPNKVDPKGTIHRITRGVDQAEVEKAKIYQRWSNIAISLIILGFGLQLISNFIN